MTWADLRIKASHAVYTVGYELCRLAFERIHPVNQESFDEFNERHRKYRIEIPLSKVSGSDKANVSKDD